MPDQLKEHIYASAPEESLFIGKRSEGHVSNYYIGEIMSDDEVAAIQTASEKLGIDVLNTRYMAFLTMVHRVSTFVLSSG
jgi:dipeptidyl-peptidase-3